MGVIPQLALFSAARVRGYVNKENLLERENLLVREQPITMPLRVAH